MSYASVIGMQQCLRKDYGANQVLVSASLQTRVGTGMVQERLGQDEHHCARDNVTHLTRKGVSNHPSSNAKGISLTVGDIVDS